MECDGVDGCGAWRGWSLRAAAASRTVMEGVMVGSCGSNRG